MTPTTVGGVPGDQPGRVTGRPLHRPVTRNPVNPYEGNPAMNPILGCDGCSIGSVISLFFRLMWRYRPGGNPA